jgi:4-alpha-glucanotransferase
MSAEKKLTRAAGVLLHPTSLRTIYGIGDIGPSACKFIDFLAKAGQKLWQVLPVGPTGYRDAPYQSISAFAGNWMLISPEWLTEAKLLDQTDITPQSSTLSSQKVDYEIARQIKEPLLKKAFEKFKKLSPDHRLRQDFNTFCHQSQPWLEDFALFHSIRMVMQLNAWVTWPAPLRDRDATALAEWKTQHSDLIQYSQFVQYVFETQWQRMRRYANEKKVEIIGDMPIFVAHDSADVWARPDLFTLQKDGSLEYMAGVPPDYFSKTGQLWGNPLYRWDRMQKENYKWFIMRFQRMFALFDWIRVDHFRGFEAYWRIPGDEKTAIKGEWVKAPGKELFRKVLSYLGNLPIIAEDLGVITSEVEQLRDSFDFPGMRVLQFAFGGDAHNPHLPHNYLPNSLAYTGTHDNDTTLGWWQQAPENQRVHFLRYTQGFHLSSIKSGNYQLTDDEKKQISQIEPRKIVEEAIRLIYRSISRWAIIPMQDLLMQDSTARMNTPSVAEGNWMYLLPEDIEPERLAAWLKDLVTLYGR